MPANRIVAVEAVPFVLDGFSRVVVVVDTESGHSGIGESGLSARERAVVGATEHLAELLVGQDANRIEHLWQVMWRAGFFPASGPTAAAASAVDIALWDIKGKVLGVPVHDLLGGPVRDRVPCYPHNGPSDDVESLLASARETVAAGWGFVRWGLASTGDDFEPRVAVRLAVEQMTALREELGDDVELCIDLHTRLDAPDAIAFCRQVEHLRPYFVEDPVRSEDLTALRRVRERTSVPIAAGEQLYGKWAFRPLIEHDLVDYARIDVCLVGGITETMKVAGACETHHIKVVTHNPLGPVSTAACLAVNLAISPFGVMEQPRVPKPSDIFPVVPRWEAGSMWASDQPGLGVEFDRDAARAAGYSPWAIPRLRRADGSFTNW